MDINTVCCAAPLRGRKGSHYDGGVRVPFIAAWGKDDPSNPYQQRLPITETLFSRRWPQFTICFPTILEPACDSNPKDHSVDGQTLKTLLSVKRDANRKQAFLMHYPHGPHRSNYFYNVPRSCLEGHLSLLPISSFRRGALPAISFGRRILLSRPTWRNQNQKSYAS